MTNDADTHATSPKAGNTDRGQVNTDAAEIYDAFFVPALFGQFPDLVLDHAGVVDGDAVLDVGCGTGVLAAAAARRVGRNGRVVGLDPNEAMLAVACRQAASIEWQPGVAEALPFDDGTFDHAISQFAPMFFVDAATAMGEMARVIAPGGFVTVATWAELERSPGYDAMVRLVDHELGSEAADALRAPFTIGTEADIAALVGSLDGPRTIDVLDGVARFESLEQWVHTDVRGWTLADLVDDEAEAQLLDRARRELAAFVADDGTVAFPAPALVATVTPVAPATPDGP